MNELNTNDPFRPLRRILRALQTPGVGASPSAIHLLCELERRPESSIKGLGERCRNGGKRIEQALGSLSKAGYIEFRDPKLRRKGIGTRMIITEKGNELMTALQMCMNEPAKAKHPQLIKSA